MLGGGKTGDVSNHLEGHLTGSTVVCWLLVFIYFQMVFIISKFWYPFCGIIYLITLGGAVVFHIIAIVWLVNNDCTSTTWYKMALVNTILFFVLLAVVLIGSLILFFVGLSAHSKKHSKVQHGNKNKSQESEEQLMPNEEHKSDRNLNDEDENKKNIKTKDEEGKGGDNKEGDTDDKDKGEKKDDEENLDEEEIY